MNTMEFFRQHTGHDDPALDKAQAILHNANSVLAIEEAQARNEAELADLRAAQEVAREAARKAQEIVDRRNAAQRKEQERIEAEEAARVAAAAEVKALADREQAIQREQALLEYEKAHTAWQNAHSDKFRAAIDQALVDDEERRSANGTLDRRVKAAAHLAQTLRLPVPDVEFWDTEKNEYGDQTGNGAWCVMFGCRFRVDMVLQKISTGGAFVQEAAIRVSSPTGQLPGGNFTIASYEEWTKRLTQNPALREYLVAYVTDTETE